MEYEHRIYFKNWSGIDIPESDFEEIFEMLDPIGIHNIIIGNQCFLREDMRRDDTLIIGFASPDFYSSFNAKPIAYASEEITYRNRTVVGAGAGSMNYTLFKPASILQSPGILLTSTNLFESDKVIPMTIGQVCHKNLINLVFRPYDIVWHDTESGHEKYASLIRLLSIVIREALPYLQLSENDFIETAAILAEKDLLRVIAEASKQSSTKAQQELLKYYNKKNEYEAGLAEINLNIRKLEQEVKNASNSSLSAASTLIDEMGKIKSLHMIESVDAYSRIMFGEFSFTTKEIYAKTQGRRFYLGKYEVRCNIFKHTVTFINTELHMRRRSHWGDHCHHPHVSEVGSACLGNVSGDFRTAFENSQYGYLAVLCLSFLSSVNINDVAGRRITNWPLADNDGNIIRDPAGDLLTCHHCGKQLPEDENELHQNCFRCAVCGEWYHKSCVSHSEIGERGLMLCNSCRSVGAEICSVCGELKPGALMSTHSITGEPICAGCSTRVSVASDSATAFQMQIITLNADNTSEEWSRIAECSSCHRTFLQAEAGEDLCPYCSNENNHIVQCRDCQQYLPDSSVITFETHDGDAMLCFDCGRDYVVCDDLKFERRSNCTLTEDNEYHYLGQEED